MTLFLNPMDLGILVLVGLFAINGYRKGLVQSIGGILALALGLFIAVNYWQPTSDYLQDNYGLTTVISKAVEDAIPVPSFESQEGMVPLFFKSTLYAYRGLANHIARLAVGGLAFGLLLMIVAAATSFLWKGLGVLLEIGMLGWLNRFGGSAFEVLRLLVILSIAAGLLMPVIQSMSQTDTPLMVAASEMTRASTFVPILEKSFQWMGTLIGM
ncbi:MAG: CvpA family protein [Solirubrobacterales bacterium]